MTIHSLYFKERSESFKQTCLQSLSFGVDLIFTNFVNSSIAYLMAKRLRIKTNTFGPHEMSNCLIILNAM